MQKSKKEQAWSLFAQGKQPKDPEVKALGIKSQSLARYFRYWKQSSPDDNPEISPSSIPSGPMSSKGADAQQVRFVPQVYTTSYSAIMRAAQDAAVEFWRWPADMTLGDFLDTALHLLFKEHGITLAGYFITDQARESLEADFLKQKRTDGEKEEVIHDS